jgi:putative endonuclease
MQYVYVLQSEIDNDLYIGCTNNLKKRLSLHNAKKVSSTAKRIPLKLIFYEAFLDTKDAFEREQFLKNGWGRNQLRKLLRNFLNK